MFERRLLLAVRLLSVAAAAAAAAAALSSAGSSLPWATLDCPAQTTLSLAGISRL
jgi:hypothetical protein